VLCKHIWQLHLDPRIFALRAQQRLKSRSFREEATHRILLAARWTLASIICMLLTKMSNATCISATHGSEHCLLDTPSRSLVSNKNPAYLQNVALDFKVAPHAVLAKPMESDASGIDASGVLLLFDVELKRLVDTQLQDARSRVESALLQGAVKTVPEAL
jgi:hypothetical protein